MSTTTKIPTFFWIISGLGTLWNVMGVVQYYMQVTMTESTLQSLPEVQQSLYADLPSWIPIVFGIATMSGVIGCIGLLLKKSWAAPVLLVSLLAVLLQMFYNLFGSRMIELMGNSAMIMPIVIAVTASYLYYFARSSAAKGWLR